MRRKMLSAIIILGLTIMINSNVLAAAPNELKQTQDNKANLQTKVQQLNSEIDGVIYKIDKNKKDMNKIANNMKNTEIKFKNIKRSSKSQNDLFNKRIKAMYITGMDGYFQVLLTSNDINDFMSRVYTVSRVVKFDKSIIDKLKQDEQDISNQKQTLVYENNKLRSIRTSNENALSKLNSDVNRQKELLAKTSQKEKSLLDIQKAAEVKKLNNSREIALNSSNFTLSRGTTGSVSSSSILSMEATAYSGDGITASGTATRKGIIAVDPRIIPIGTNVYVQGYGYAIAADTGGAIKGNIIDLFFPSNADAQSWGRRSVNVYILK